MPTGLYLYCLCESAQTPGGIKAPGVNGKGGVFIRAFDGIAAVVSEVNGDDFNEMQKKAQADIQWIKDKALAHEMVVEEAMGQPLRLFPVIPVKFGVIFNTAERLAEVLKQQHAAIMGAFDRIRARQEWSVKLFLQDVGKFKDDIKKQNGKLRNKDKELAGMSSGMAYFMEAEFNSELERECSQRLDSAAYQAFEELKSHACEAVLVKILDSKLTGRSERMFLNSACLVAHSQLPEFQKAIVMMRGNLAPSGILVEQSGPWPPYHFTEFSHD